MRFKKINQNETVFYVIEVSSTKFSIFDSIMDLPIYHGHWAKCEAIIKNIKQHKPKSSIYYYETKKNGLNLSPFWSFNV